MRWGRPVWGRIAAFSAVVVSLPIAAPQLLAFPYSAQIAGHRVRSVEPISSTTVAAVAEADRKVARSGLGGARPSDQPIYLTGGGWRWRWLSAPDGGAMALTRAVNEAIVVNRLDETGQFVRNGRKLGGQRRLDGVIAHEMTHGSIRAHFGLMADLRYAQRLREGYCDYVAGGGSLSDAEAEALLRSGTSHPALPYWEGRKQVESTLARPGQSVDSLFSAWRERL